MSRGVSSISVDELFRRFLADHPQGVGPNNRRWLVRVHRSSGAEECGILRGMHHIGDRLALDLTACDQRNSAREPWLNAGDSVVRMRSDVISVIANDNQYELMCVDADGATQAEDGLRIIIRAVEITGQTESPAAHSGARAMLGFELMTSPASA